MLNGGIGGERRSKISVGGVMSAKNRCESLKSEMAK